MALAIKTPTNKTVHWICVPIIYFSIMGLLVSIPSDYLVAPFEGERNLYLNWGTFVGLLVMVFYIRLSFKMFLGMFLWTLFCLWGNIQIDPMVSASLWLLNLILFVLAWIGQFWGHKVEGQKPSFEGQKPSFLEDIQFLLIGPAWLMSFIYKKLGINY